MENKPKTHMGTAILMAENLVRQLKFVDEDLKKLRLSKSIIEKELEAQKADRLNMVDKISELENKLTLQTEALDLVSERGSQLLEQEKKYIEIMTASNIEIDELNKKIKLKEEELKKQTKYKEEYEKRIDDCLKVIDKLENQSLWSKFKESIGLVTY